MTPEGVLFDAGNTILEPDYAVLSEIAARHGLVLRPAALREAAGRSRSALDRHLRLSRHSTEASGLRDYVLARILDGLAVPAAHRPEPLLRELSEALPRIWTVPGEGAVQTLAGLEHRGVRRGVVSNSDGTVEEMIRAAGLGSWFETVVDSRLVGVEKPDPEIFHVALGRMGLAPDRTVHVGDLPSVDVVGARAAGLRPLLLDPFDAFPDCDASRIRSLPEILDLCDRGVL